MGYGRGRASYAEKTAIRTVVLASADADFRQRLRQHLTAMRWQVREAGGGAEAIALLETAAAEAMLVDSTLPDLAVAEFAAEMRSRHPEMDLLRIDGGVEQQSGKSPRRNELLHALRQAQENAPGGSTDMVAWADAPVAAPQAGAAERLAPRDKRAMATMEVAASLRTRRAERPSDAGFDQPAEAEARWVEAARSVASPVEARGQVQARSIALPEMVGEGPGMRELARLVRLVAPRSTTVLIEGATGTGKELVAKAVHRLSPRSGKPFVVLNCAAIPEALLEAELFGHTRGAFTGAVQSRTGRIEAAHGGTLFLDEIGEMPLSLQPKMLRFLESGELQRVGDNETMRVDVRVVAATHQPLRQRAAERAFRLDLYHRLAVFPVAVPALCERMEDVLPLALYLLGRLGEEMPVKRLSPGAASKLMDYDWPGNVRELAHVLERAAILAEDRMEIGAGEIWF
jgi:DNA-binding NtrC family response regulator